MYYKGSNLIHTIRQVINDDEKFRTILRGLNKEFYHKTVTSKQVEEYISARSGKDLSKVFHQYLRTTQIPVLHLSVEKSDLKYRWEETVDGFNMPVKLTNGTWLQPSTKWQTVKLGTDKSGKLEVDPNFYVKVKRG
jgi:aminopeptidase N